MKILVAGLGALGTVYACLLSAAGHRVTGLCRMNILEKISQDGVSISGIWGEHAAKLERVVASAGELSGETFAMIIVTVKSYATEEIAQQLAPLITDDSHVFLLQNGYGNFETAAKFLPTDKLVLGRVIFGAEALGPGESKVTVIADDVRLGSPDNRIDTSVLQEFARIFNEAGIPTQATEEIMKYVWGKIIYNSALNPLGAILEVNYGKLAEIPETRVLMDQIITEIFALLQFKRIETFWLDAQAYQEVFYSALLPPTAAHHSSMLQDIRRGKPTEIAALNGAIVSLARQADVAVPINEAVMNIVKAKESL